jgi:energy-coupling factor transporter ATP-binding protein EcfA2
MFSKGSEWRKWDLHFHTPSSYDYKDKSVTNEKIIEVLKENNISLVAITDHHTIDVEKITELQNLAGNDIKILPGIEFCSDSRGREPIHFIGIFPETNTKRLKHIRDTILIKTDIDEQKQKGRKENEIYCNLDETAKLIRELRGLVTIHAGKKSNSIENITNSLPYAMAQKKDIAENIDIFELGKEEDQKDYKDIVFKEIGTYPMIICSDNHNINDYSLKQNCWIKADSTFEGLKQIIYEPEERVKIQKENPNFEFDKPYFERISIKDDIKLFENEKVTFLKKEITLNKNLVTIIGGRGTGKSLLVNYLAHTFNKNDKEFTDNKEFEVDYAKNNVENADIATFNAKDKSQINFIFIEQSKLKTITDKKTVGEEFKKLLQLEDLQFDETLNKEIIKLLGEIKELKNWFNYETENSERINDKDFNEKKKVNAEQLLKTITTKENEAKLLKYTENVDDIKNYENLFLELNKLKEKLEDYSKELNVKILTLNDKLGKDFKIEEIIFDKQLQAVEKAKNHFGELKAKKESENIEIKKQFESEGYKGDLLELLKNAERYQRDINGATKQLVLIGKKERILRGKIELRNKLGKKIKQEYDRQAKIIEDSWDNILNNIGNEDQKQIMEKILAGRGIHIKGKVTFDLVKFNTKLVNYVDKRVYRKLGENLGILNLESYYEFINKKLGDFIEGDKKDTTKKINLGRLFFNLSERKEYLSTIVEISYNGKTLEKLSAGQKGTLYLLLQLATKAFSTPLIFDQPEDDLDNEFIIEELIDLFKELKKYRQIIIVTHNANLVVTADTEQVVVANNNNENITYFSGSLEDHAIIKNVCRILEGGKNAFEKRKRRYSSIVSKDK